jgi:hypothetical protein
MTATAAHPARRLLGATAQPASGFSVAIPASDTRELDGLFAEPSGERREE